MLQHLYACLLHLHPRAFRERFSEEMLSIFDESPQKGALLLDAGVSLLRQRMLRPRDASAPAAAPVPDGVPIFHIIDDSPPRVSALLPGALLSFGFFAAVAFAVSHGGSTMSLLIGTGLPIPRPLSADRNSITPTDPTTSVKVGEKRPDPWLEFAKAYFQIMPVLRALDRDHDYFLSKSEIAKASAALSTLDADHDGKLSALECGAQANAPTLAFMRAQPVLAALDADHDGEISAYELVNASAALRTLDISGDGILAPAEFAPASVVSRILSREAAR